MYTEKMLELSTSISELEDQEKTLQQSIDKAIKNYDAFGLMGYEPLIKLVRERLEMLKAQPDGK